MSNKSTKLVAIVDDDLHLRESIQDLLDAEGYESELFNSAEQFLASGRATDVACVLADVRMGGMTGIEMLPVLQLTGAYPPVIIMTSFADEKMRGSAFNCGAAAFLSKPLDSGELLSCLRVILAGDT